MEIEQIISNYCPKLSLFTGASKNLNTNKGAFSKYKEAIKKYLDIADSRQAVSDAFLSAFSSNPEMFGSEIAGLDEYDTENFYGYEISEESASLIMSMFENDDLTSILTFTDGSGTPYSFLHIYGSEVEGYQSIISTQRHPTSLKDLFLYWDGQGKFYVNPIIRTAEYFDGEVIAGVHATSIQDACSVISSILNISPESDDILTQLISINQRLDIYDDEQTILDCINVLLTYLGQPESNTCDVLVSNFHDIVVAIYNDLGVRRVRSSTIYGLVSDLVVNNELIDVIRTTYNAIVNYDHNQLINALRSSVENKSAVVRNFANQIILGFTRSGIIGAFSVIIDLIKSVFSSTPNNYQVFDTKGSIPQAFSAGFVAIVTNIASTLFSVMSSIMNPIISIIGAVGYGVINTIQSVVNANVSQEYARVQNLDESENFAPYAICGIKLTTTDGSSIMNAQVYNDDGELVTIKKLLDWATLSGNPILTISWYGAIVKLAYANPVIDEYGNLTATEFVINVFPSVNNTESLIFDDSIEDYIYDVLKVPDSVSLDSQGVGTLYYNSMSPLISVISTQLMSAITSARHDSTINFEPVIVNDESGSLAGYVGLYDDVARRQVYKNILLLLCLVRLNSGTQIDASYHSGSMSVKSKLVNFVPTIVLDGSEHTILSLAFGAIASSTYALGTYDGHQIFITKDTSNFSALGVTCTSMFNVSSALTAYNFVQSLLHERYLLKSDINSNRPEITFKASYKDVPYYLPPKYTRGSVITSLVIGAVIAVTTAVAVAITTLAVKRKIQKQRSIHQAKVEQAWQEFAQDPSPDNYKTYRRTVKSNNRFSRVFGGTKYDYVNYWNGDVSSTKSTFSSYETISSYFNSENVTTVDQPIDSISAVIKLISGK